jgi:hypothetical protein
MIDPMIVIIFGNPIALCLEGALFLLLLVVLPPAMKHTAN